MRKRLVQIAFLLSLACVASAIATWPFAFDGPITCNRPGCYYDLPEIPVGGSGQADILAWADCYSGLVPMPDAGVRAQYCQVPVYLVASAFNQSTMYWDILYGGMVTVDGIRARATSFFEVAGLLYPYWTGYKDSDCYDDSVRNYIPGGVAC
jgi:hypothetical protein